LDRLGGGIGTRGPGESQLETDRRRAQQRIHILKNKIGKVRKQRKLYRRKRKKNELPIVALVGYTNTGKSTLLNKLTQADVSVEDKLFATLDPTTRRLVLSDNNVALVTDTVGFIRKLPPTIISAFQATLEELSEADLLVKVIDLSLPDAAQQDKIVEDILTNLGLDDKPKITVFNKMDLIIKSNDDRENILKSFLAEQDLAYSENIILMSATMGWGMSDLRSQILDLLK
jgi:GTP-binding protein HflX